MTSQARTTKEQQERDAADNKLIHAADEWLTTRGGKGIVGGPTCIIQMPGSTEANFYVAVKMLGRKPKQKREGL